jgi:hypothetical protein
VSTSFLGIVLGIMLTGFENPQALPKDAVNPKGRRNQKTGAK